MTESASLTAPKKRVRLAPAIRKQLILDAALKEFSVHGFGATGTEKIAQRAGLSQAGLYAHFKSKEAILEALFNEVLRPKLPEWLAGEAFSDAMVDQLIDDWYSRMEDPRFLCVFRLLINEGGRVPDLVNHWRQQTVVPFLAEQDRCVAALAQSGQVQDNLFTEHFQIATAPLGYALMLRLVHGGAGGGFDEEIVRIRESHRRLLKEFVARRKN